MADGLSRTIFEEDENDLPEVRRELAWVWKDGKEGYKTFLRQLDDQQRSEVLNLGTLAGSNVFLIYAKALSAVLPNVSRNDWREAYGRSSWFGLMY